MAWHHGYCHRKLNPLVDILNACREATSVEKLATEVVWYLPQEQVPNFISGLIRNQFLQAHADERSDQVYVTTKRDLCYLRTSKETLAALAPYYAPEPSSMRRFSWLASALCAITLFAEKRARYKKRLRNIADRI